MPDALRYHKSHLVPFGEFGGAPESVRDYAQGLEAAGYDFVEAPDHVLGALGGGNCL